MVDSKAICFVLDTGAQRSAISGDTYRGERRNAEPSMGINGILTKTYKTPLLPITDMTTGQTLMYHSFRIIPACPVNLLGRDLIGKLQIDISLNREGGVFIESPLLGLSVKIPEAGTSLAPDQGALIPDYCYSDEVLSIFPPDHPVWASSGLDVGHILCTPYKARLKPGVAPVYHKQYPLSREKEEGIAPMVEEFLKKGILKPIISPYNTPINPIKKSDGSYRFVQDLRAINNLIVPIAPIVPDVPSLITSIPADAEFFTVVDLANAYFSVPVDEETQLLLAFSILGQQLTWCRLPQGYIDSPVVYSIALRATLQCWAPRQGSVLIQYVDDLLLASSQLALCQEDSISLLEHLAQTGHKVSRKKLQWCKKTVEYLGFTLSHGERMISHKRAAALVGLPRPQTKKDILTFLGMVGYCRQWIPDCSFYDKILRQVTLPENPDFVKWSDEMVNAYVYLKTALVTAPGLGLPDYCKMFHLFARDNCKTMAAVLAQDHAGKLRPVAFFSRVVPVPVQGMPACLRALASCAMAVEMATPFTMGHPMELHTTHQILFLLKNLHTQHMSAQRLSGYEVILLSNPSLTVRYSSPTSGPAPILNALLGLKWEGDELPPQHDCIEIIHQDTSPRADLLSSPMEGVQTVFVDGSCSRPNDTTYHAGYAVVQLPDIILEAKPIPFQSAQAAELIALTRACQLFEGQEVNIYTDSKYAYGTTHDNGMIWKRRGFVAADGKAISHSSLVDALLTAIHLPRRVAVIHCKAHTHGTDSIARGNALADAAAKQAASATQALVQLPPLVPPSAPWDQILQDLQAFATKEDLDFWVSQGLELDPSTGLISKEGRPGIPQGSASLFISQYHGVGHRGSKVTAELIAKDFYILHLPSLCKTFVSRCIECIRNNPNISNKPLHDHLQYPTSPFTHLQIDFTHMPKVGKRQVFLLVIVDMFSRWIECFVTTKEDARTVVKILTQEVIPRWGCPVQINSDNGPAFTSRVCQELVKLLQIEWKFHIPYHPQSSGIVERMNRTIKDKLRKATGGTYHKWKNSLPAILAEIRMTPSKATGLSPFEILMGRPFPTPWTKKPLVIERGDLEQIQEEYCKNLIKKLHSTYGNVSRTLPLPSQEPTHSLAPGDVVVIRQLNRNKKQEYPFGPPTTVIAVTRTAVLTEQSNTWIHASRIKKVPPRPEKQDTDKGGETGGLKPRRVSEAGGVDSEEDVLATLTPEFWEDSLLIDSPSTDSVSAHLDCH